MVQQSSRRSFASIIEQPDRLDHGQQNGGPEDMHNRQLSTHEDYRARVRSYYNDTAELYLESLGSVCQAGLIEGLDPDPYRSTILYIADRAGLRDGLRILDAGSGFCGPSIHLCQLFHNLSVEAITLSDEQARHARLLVAAAGFSERIQVTVGDYHELPFADASFDAVLFLESTGYSYDPPRLFNQLHRVLRENGSLYIKDVFCFDGPLSLDQIAELASLDDVYAQITRPISFYVDQLRSSRFKRVSETLLASIVSTRIIHSAMWKDEDGIASLTNFGKRHFRPFRNLPLVFGEISASK